MLDIDVKKIVSAQVQSEEKAVLQRLQEQLSKAVTESERDLSKFIFAALDIVMTESLKSTENIVAKSLSSYHEELVKALETRRP